MACEHSRVDCGLDHLELAGERVVGDVSTHQVGDLVQHDLRAVQAGSPRLVVDHIPVAV